MNPYIDNCLAIDFVVSKRPHNRITVLEVNIPEVFQFKLHNKTQIQIHLRKYFKGSLIFCHKSLIINH